MTSEERTAPEPGPAVEGRDGAVPRYRERLTPPWWLWLAVVFVTGTLAVAYGFAIGMVAGWLTFAITTGAIAWGLVAGTPLVQVDELVLRAGRARLPLAHVGEVTPLDAEAARVLRGTGADVRAFLLIRPFVATAVRVDVADERDPHPYWLVSTRHPEQLAAALELARPPRR